jgi:HEAT repeat protein
LLTWFRDRWRKRVSQSKKAPNPRENAEAHGQHEDECGSASLIQMLRVADFFVRRNAVNELAKIGAIEPLITALEDNSHEVRLAAVEALGHLGDLRVLEPLIRCLQDKWWQVRSHAAFALGRIGNRQAVEPLIQAFENGECSAAWALGCLGDPRAVEPLIKALSTEESGPRWAAEALGKLGDPRAIDPLIRLLGHAYSDIRSAAAVALDKLGEPKWKEIVRGTLNNEDFHRLAKCEDPRAVEPLLLALESRHLGGRMAAAEALAKIALNQPSLLGNRWSTIHMLTGQAHDDQYSPDGCGHYDTGIGVGFPDPPPGGDF